MSYLGAHNAKSSSHGLSRKLALLSLAWHSYALNMGMHIVVLKFTCHRKEEYSAILPHCDQEISSNGPHSAEVCTSFTFLRDFGFLILSFKALLLRATFYILTKQQDLAMEDLTNLIGARFNQESLEIYV